MRNSPQMASFSLYCLVNFIINDFKLATFLFQLIMIKFTELNPTINITIVPLLGMGGITNLLTQYGMMRYCHLL